MRLHHVMRIHIFVRFSLVMVCAAYLAFHDAAPTSAHMCAWPRDFEQKMDRSDGVFQGTVIAQESAGTFVHPVACGGPGQVCRMRIATFDVSRVWKGAVKDRLTVVTDDGAYAYRLKLNEEYLVYGDKPFEDRADADYMTSRCSGTLRLYKDGDGYTHEEDRLLPGVNNLEELGQGRAPREFQPWAVVMSAAILLVLSVIGVKPYRWLRTRHKLP